ncbi:MAG: diphthine--ammonia ligase, partial [Candidatus Woesearchaeota archaeon]
MCGILGFFGTEHAKVFAGRGLQSLAHRGSDAAHLVCSRDAAVGHCLHAINGFVPQPLTSGKFVFGANCEIYTWKHLAQGQQAANDAQALFVAVVNAYAQGKVMDLLSTLDGVYAFFLWDQEQQKLVLARDLLGEKPLWYYYDPAEGTFAFASEKKALVGCGLLPERIFELNPRLVAWYDAASRSLSFTQRQFFTLPSPCTDDEQTILTTTTKLLHHALAKRIPEGLSVGLLFSGGVDSCYLALKLKEWKVPFTCYTAAIVHPTIKESEDLHWAKKAAQELGFPLKIVTCTLDEVQALLPVVLATIEETNPIKAGVAFPFFLAAKQAKADGLRVMLSGLGSEEIFAGYQRHQQSSHLGKECLYGLAKLYERDLYRDDTIMMHHTLELRLPYLDLALVQYVLSLSDRYKIQGQENKRILRMIAAKEGLPYAFAYRKKKAAQYGSNADKAIALLAKRARVSKASYLHQLARGQDNAPQDIAPSRLHSPTMQLPAPAGAFSSWQPSSARIGESIAQHAAQPSLRPSFTNPRLGVLWSTGKDSALAAWIMHQQHYPLMCLITLVSKNPDSYLYHGPNTTLAGLHAQALGVGIVLQHTDGKKEEELDDLRSALLEAKARYAIEGIVTGALFSSYQRERIEKLCDSLGLKCFSPLWHMDQKKELSLLLSSGFVVCMVKVAAEGLDASFLGKHFTTSFVEQLHELEKNYGIQVAGEGGEYETLVLDAPFFSSRLEIIKSHMLHDGSSATLVIDEAVL